MNPVLIALGLGDLYGLVHYITHHRSGLTAAITGVLVWAGAHSHLPLLAAEKGRRGAHGKQRRALRQAAKARKQATA